MAETYEPQHAAEPDDWETADDPAEVEPVVPSTPLEPPTQVRRPWRATLRTAFQALLALAVMAPVLVEATGLRADQWPWLAGVLAVAAAVTRVMALPQVEQFLERFLPFLAANPNQQED